MKSGHFRVLRPVLFLVAVLALSSLAPTWSHAQIARLEIHFIQTQSPTDQEFLTGRKDGKPATIAGELQIPRLGTDRQPAVILVHSSFGASGLVDQWAREFNALGLATFILDSFTGRGIVSTMNDQAQLGRLPMILDIYRALELLGKHPRIDPARVAVMGFSRGGQATLYSSLKRFWGMHGAGGNLRLAAYIALYPSCDTTFAGDVDVADSPIRIFHGAADDYVPVGPCRAYVDRLRRAGKDVSLTEYPDAHHVFDYPALKNPLKLPQAVTTRRCRLEEGPDGRIINSQTKQVFGYDDPCVERGTTVAYHPQAHADAQKAIAEFLTTALKLK